MLSGVPTDSPNLHSHIDNLKRIESLLSVGNTFLYIVNSSTQEYHHITTNVGMCTGIDAKVHMENGVPYVLSRMHPDDQTLWLEGVQIMSTEIMKLAKAERLKVNMQCTFRFYHASEYYINLVDNSIPLELDKDGIPYLWLGQVNVVGTNESGMVKVQLLKLNDRNEYETIKFLNMTQRSKEELLTDRERDIVRLVALGDTSEVIAEKLAISSETVKTHRKKILKKLNLKSTAALVSQYAGSEFY